MKVKNTTSTVNRYCLDCNSSLYKKSSRRILLDGYLCEACYRKFRYNTDDRFRRKELKRIKKCKRMKKNENYQ